MRPASPPPIRLGSGLRLPVGWGYLRRVTDPLPVDGVHVVGPSKSDEPRRP